MACPAFSFWYFPYWDTHTRDRWTCKNGSYHQDLAGKGPPLDAERPVRNPYQDAGSMTVSITWITPLD
jgi:hypothetical protein